MSYFLQSAPYLMMKPQNVSLEGAPYLGNDRFEGYCADLAEKVAEVIGIDYLIRPAKDGLYGARDENGTWNGMIGELVRNVSVKKSFIRACVPFEYKDTVCIVITILQWPSYHYAKRRFLYGSGVFVSWALFANPQEELNFEQITQFYLIVSEFTNLPKCIRMGFWPFQNAGWNYVSIPNFNGSTVEVWEWISNIILHFTGHGITYPCWD